VCVKILPHVPSLQHNSEQTEADACQSHRIRAAYLQQSEAYRGDASKNG
jgi:hypothetical protein